MTDGPLLRLLEMVQRELGAADARIEIGGQEPRSASSVWVGLSESRRVVALFDEPPADPAKAREKLVALVEAFSGTASESAAQSTRPPGALTRALLNEQLGMLTERVDSVRIVVIDETSPVIWGSSDPFQRSAGGVDEAIRTAEVDAAAGRAGLDFASLLASGLEAAGRELADAGVEPALTGRVLNEIELLHADRITRDPASWQALVLSARAIARLRYRPVLQAVHPRIRRVEHGERFGFLAKPFASSYWLVAVFDQPFSELRVEGTVVRVLPRIERLVLALPPVDPPPSRGHVVPLHRPK